MRGTRSTRDTSASGGQTGVLSHDNALHSVGHHAAISPDSVPDSNLGVSNDSTQEVGQDVPSQSAISSKKSKVKWRRYSPGFKVRAVRLTRATASDGTRVGLRRAAMVLGIRHDAIVVWQRHLDSLREQAIAINEDVEEDLSELIHRSVQVGSSGVGGKRNLPKDKEALLAQLVIEKQAYTVDGIVHLAREVWPAFMPNPNPDAPSKNHALWYNRASTWVSRFSARHNINRQAFDNAGIMGNDHTAESASAGMGLPSHMMLQGGYRDIIPDAVNASGGATSQT